MSVTFERPVGKETAEMLKEFFGPPVAEDGKTFLFDRINEIQQTQMKQVAKSAKQTATVNLHDVGEVKVVGGVKYRVTPRGWVRV